MRFKISFLTHLSGANSGLGKVTALELAKRGAHVHLLCRDPVSGKSTVDELIATTQNQAIELHLVDMSRPMQILNFYESFKSRKRLDILVNNAGVLLNERVQTADGLETTFATNTLGTYYLTNLMIPLLGNSSDPRVINVSSGGMYNSKLDATDLQSLKNYDGVAVYAQTKVIIFKYLILRGPKLSWHNFGRDSTQPFIFTQCIPAGPAHLDLSNHFHHFMNL